jgi:hypothetical protein
VSFSYSAPPTVARDEVRLAVGDTNEDEPLLEDEELDYLLTVTGSSVRFAAVAACRAIAAKFSRRVDFSLGGNSFRFADQAKAYMALAEEIETNGLPSEAGQALYAIPLFTGQSIGDKQRWAQDTDAEQPAFTRDLHGDPPPLHIPRTRVGRPWW